MKGLEDNTYTITEVRTDNGYTLLKDDIEVVISQAETTKICDIYASDVLGLIQNDPRYATIIHDTGDLKNMPQKHLEHRLLTASATVDGNAVTMLTDNGSANAEAPAACGQHPWFWPAQDRRQRHKDAHHLRHAPDPLRRRLCCTPDRL